MTNYVRKHVCLIRGFSDQKRFPHYCLPYPNSNGQIRLKGSQTRCRRLDQPSHTAIFHCFCWLIETVNSQSVILCILPTPPHYLLLFAILYWYSFDNRDCLVKNCGMWKSLGIAFKSSLSLSCILDIQVIQRKNMNKNCKNY